MSESTRFPKISSLADSSSGSRDPVEVLADEFLDRQRNGEHPTIEEYAAKHPELADAIRAAFPALVMLEGLGHSTLEPTGSIQGAKVTQDRLQRLGDFRVVREIGRGGMGVVYEAKQESLGRRVTLKVMAPGMLHDQKQIQRFEREAKAAAKLHHTNIVPVFSVGHEEGRHYYVMQFIAGQGLDDVIEDVRRLKAEGAPVKANDAPTGQELARSLVSGRFHVP